MSSVAIGTSGGDCDYDCHNLSENDSVGANTLSKK